MKQDNIDLLNALKGMKLKKCSDDYCEWYALLTVEEAKAIAATSICKADLRVCSYVQTIK